jgi:hypothetical protein
MTFRLHATFLVLALTVLGVRPAAAQNPQRPFRGLFGGAQPLNTRGQMIDLSTSAFVGWDEPQNVVNPLESTSDDRTVVSGPYSGGSAALSYTHPGEKLDFNGSGSAFTGYFPDNKESPWYQSYSVAGNLSWRADLSRRTHFHFSEGASASTDYRVGALLGTGSGGIGSIGSSFDNSLVRQPSMITQTRAELSHDFSVKSNFSASYGFQYAHFFQDDQFPDTGIHNVGARYRHRLTKYFGYHLGYSYDHPVDFSGGPPLRGIHNIDAGLDYSRALSLTRTTKFSFSTGTTIASGTQEQNGQTTFSSPHFFVVGNVALTQELGQTWYFATYYDRSVSYDPGFTQPGLYDTAGVSLSGLVSRHLDVSVNGQYQVGRIGLESPNYRSWNASAQIRSAITRNIAAYAYYYYFLSDLNAGVAVPLGVPHYVARNGVRAGITAWLPLWYGRGAP